MLLYSFVTWCILHFYNEDKRGTCGAVTSNVLNDPVERRRSSPGSTTYNGPVVTRTAPVGLILLNTFHPNCVTTGIGSDPLWRAFSVQLYIAMCLSEC